MSFVHFEFSHSTADVSRDRFVGEGTPPRIDVTKVAIPAGVYELREGTLVPSAIKPAAAQSERAPSSANLNV